MQQWLGENPEEEEPEGNPCPICNTADREDILLLCDGCDAAYHTVCMGLEQVPEGDWYCMECQHSGLFGPDQQASAPRPARPNLARGRPRNRRNQRGERLRTRARLRRAQRQARDAAWHGPWGQFSGRFYEMSDVDLDNHDDEDVELGQYRQFQLHELDRWQQRAHIAHRWGAFTSFASSIPRQISQQLQATRPSTPPAPLVETPDERRAWGIFDRVRDSQVPVSNGRKRKTRSVTASPAEPAPEAERKLKRPRTRRLAIQGESSAAGAANGNGSSVPGPALASASSPVTAGSPTWQGPEAASVQNGGANGRAEADTPLVSSLLKELEPGAPVEADAEGTAAASDRRHPPEASSPALSPSPSNRSSPRALSLTPPPLSFADSPTIPLSTHIQPRYRPANYSPTRSNNEQSDSEFKAARTEAWSLELQQPRPRRPHHIPQPQQRDGSPTQTTMTPEEKKSINDIVKGALRPHWHAKKLSSDQYAAINRDISRKLYDEVKDASSLDDDTKRSWERRASQEVAQALAELEA